MAQKISQMTEQTTASMTETGTSDFLGGYTATGGNANRKFSLSGLANYFLNKLKMTLGGSSQTVKSAIDALNSNSIQKNAIILNNTKNLNDFKNQNCCGFYYCQAGVANAPTDWSWLLVINGSGTIQVCFTQSRIFIRAYTGNPLAWTNWASIVLT